VEGPGYSDDTTWKWMLYGDDDIYWFVDNLLPALEELDPDVAYYVTDDIMGCCHGAFKWCTTMATACQPPTRKPVRDVNNTCDLQRPAAPCLQSQLPLDEHAAEGFCAGRQKEVWFNGGRGAAFSRGLLRSITAEQWLECEGPRGPQWGGDNRITGCLSRHDVGPTMLSRSMDTCRYAVYPNQIRLLAQGVQHFAPTAHHVCELLALTGRDGGGGWLSRAMQFRSDRRQDAAGEVPRGGAAAAVHLAGVPGGGAEPHLHHRPSQPAPRGAGGRTHRGSAYPAHTVPHGSPHSRVGPAASQRHRHLLISR